MKLYKLSSPTFNYAAFQSFLADEHITWRKTERSTDGEDLVEVSGRVCYMSFSDKQSPRTNLEYIANLIDQQHDSVLEHATWTLLVTGMSRALSHQIVRHRIGFSYSQLSQQYHDESEAQFVIPPTLANNPRARAIWNDSIAFALNSYRTLLKECNEDALHEESGAPRERIRRIRSDARSVLPNATETKLVITANARSLRHFLEVRGATLGDIESRQVSSLIYTAVSEDAPALFQGFVHEILEDGFPVVRKL